MTHAPESHAGMAPLQEKQYPPIAELALGAMIAVIVGGIVIASQIPGDVSLVFPSVLLAVAALLVAAAIALLAQQRDFAWLTFRRVFGWALLAYVVLAGMIEFVFIADETPGRVLTIMTLSLVLFAIDIPLILAFSVERFQER